LKYKELSYETTFDFLLKSGYCSDSQKSLLQREQEFLSLQLFISLLNSDFQTTF